MNLAYREGERMIEATKSWLAGAICAAALAGPAGKAAAQAEFEWVRSYTGALIPGGAYVGGQEDGTPLLICRAPYLGGIYPGKLVKGNCNISYDSKEIYLHDFDILVGQGGQWAPPQPGLAGAFIAGYERGGPLFLCQAMYSGGLHLGKIYDGKCDISFAGREIPIRRFNVFYIGAQTVETAGGAPYPPTVIYQSHTNIQNNTTTTTTTIVKKVYVAPPAYDASAVAAAAAARQRAQDAARAQALQDQRDREDQARQKAEYQRNQDAQKAAAEAAAAQARAEGEAEENRQALTAQAQATEEEAKKQAEIRKGEEEENRMAAEAAAKAQAEEDARKQEEIKRGEEEENRMAAEAEAKAKAEEPPPPSESPPRDEPSPN